MSTKNSRKGDTFLTFGVAGIFFGLITLGAPAGIPLLIIGLVCLGAWWFTRAQDNAQKRASDIARAVGEGKDS